MKHSFPAFKTPVVVGSFLTVIAVVLGGVSSLAVASSPKQVTVSIDGASRQVATEETTVQGLFKQLDLEVSAHDQVTPGLTQPLPNRGSVQLLRAKPVVEERNGLPKVNWKVVPSSAPKKLPVYVDGKLQENIVDLSASPRAAIQAQGITLSPLDRVLIGKHEGKQAVLVSRVSRAVETAKEEIPLKVDKTEDSSLKPGQEVVDEPGQTGEVAKTSFTEKINGKIVFSSKPVTVTLRKAKPKKVRVGKSQLRILQDPNPPSRHLPTWDMLPPAEKRKRSPTKKYWLAVGERASLLA